MCGCTSKQLPRLGNLRIRVGVKMRQFDDFSLCGGHEEDTPLPTQNDLPGSLANSLSRQGRMRPVPNHES